jgi:hypothetical protein
MTRIHYNLYFFVSNLKIAGGRRPTQREGGREGGSEGGREGGRRDG